MVTQSKWLYCCDTTKEHSVSKRYPNCLEKIDEITKGESIKKLKTRFSEEIALNLDKVESDRTRGKGNSNSTMDIAFGIKKEGKSKQFILCEYRLNYKNVNNIKKSDLDSKISHSKNLLGAEIPIQTSYLFVFSSKIQKTALNKLRRFSSNKSTLYVAIDVPKLYSSYFDIPKNNSFGPKQK